LLCWRCRCCCSWSLSCCWLKLIIGIMFVASDY
jgi:hypothetical protein